MASTNLGWCVAAFRGEGILVNGFVLSGNHASLTAALRVDVPYEGEPTEKRHVLVMARYRIRSEFPVEAMLEVDVTKPMTAESVIRRWKRDLSQGSIWRTVTGREFVIDGPRGHLLGTATPFVMMHCSAMMMMAASVAKAEPEGSHLGIAAQRLAYRLQDRLNTAAEEFDELAGG